MTSIILVKGPKNNHQQGLVEFRIWVCERAVSRMYGIARKTDFIRSGTCRHKSHAQQIAKKTLTRSRATSTLTRLTDADLCGLSDGSGQPLPIHTCCDPFLGPSKSLSHSFNGFIKLIQMLHLAFFSENTLANIGVDTVPSHSNRKFTKFNQQIKDQKNPDLSSFYPLLFSCQHQHQRHSLIRSYYQLASSS